MKLKKYIKKVGAKAFAEATGLSIYTVYAYSAGVREPSPSTARRIERVTDGRVKITDCYEPADMARSA